MIFQSSITEKGQTTVPSKIRSMLNLKPGDKLRYVTREGKVYLEAKTRRAVELAGMFHEQGRPPFSIDDLKETIGTAISHHVMGQDDRN